MTTPAAGTASSGPEPGVVTAVAGDTGGGGGGARRAGGFAEGVGGGGGGGGAPWYVQSGWGSFGY